MIKLLDILKEIDDTSGVWYHGSTANINQNDLDPLFRQNKGKEFMIAKAAGEGNTGSQNSTGIYFGKDKECIDAFCPMNYTGFNSKWAKEGFMYEMRLKPEAKVINKSDLHNISKEAFDRLRQEGTDALISGSELNILNPEVIQSFRKIMQWKKTPALYPVVRSKTQTDQKITFNNDQELLDFLKKELGDYELNNKDGFKKYISKDDNIDKSFEYTTDKKWIK